MKVFCKNCKQCEYREFASLGVNWGWFCKLRDKITFDSIGHKEIDFSESDCEKLNQDFNCSHYQRKWWKFYIKQR